MGVQYCAWLLPGVSNPGPLWSRADAKSEGAPEAHSLCCVGRVKDVGVPCAFAFRNTQAVSPKKCNHPGSNEDILKMTGIRAPPFGHQILKQ